MKLANLTGRDNYFENFVVGRKWRHARGKTVGVTENVLLTHLVMNSADAHFNDHKMQSSPFGRVLSYGGVNFSIVIGLAAQDTGENAWQELGLDRIRLKKPVFHGDTLYALSEVLETRDAEQPDVGEVRFRHVGINQNDAVVCELERRVLIKRRAFWVNR
jgi:itaconyl-CoA hydratase